MYKKTPLLCSLALATALPMGAVAADDFKVSTKGGLSIKNSDGSASFTLGGRLQWDYDNTDSDAGDEETLEVRRARLAAKGVIGNWGYKMQFNLGEDDGGSVEDLYFTYNGFGKMAKLVFGKHREAFGLEDQTSSNDISLLERSAITEAYAPGRNAGVQITGADNGFYYGVGLYRDVADDEESIAETALTGRVTYLAVNDDDLLVHVGGSARLGDVSDKFGLEFAGVYGSTHFQAEYIEQSPDVGDDADGYYFQVGYIFTGETRPYKNGVFKRVKPSGGTAIELVGRFEDGVGRYSDIGLDTAEGSQFSVGLNFYPNNAIRLGFSYMDGSVETDVPGVELDGSEFRFRTQLSF